MSASLQQQIFEQLDQCILIDPHSHINPLSPASRNLNDIMGYHYYTELVHSAGMPQSRIEEPQLTARQRVERLVEGIEHIDNTVQFSWLLQAAHDLFGLEIDRLDAHNWQQLYQAAESKMSQPTWEEELFQLSKLEAVFLTNDFDDPLAGFDTRRYIPCLRTDELVFHLFRPQVQDRLQGCTAISLTHLSDLREAITQRFAFFTSRNAKACAISLPPSFTPQHISDGDAEKAFSTLMTLGEATPQEDRQVMAYWVFWELATNCRNFKLPFDLMIGVNRQVYPTGVYQGQDLYDSRVSLIQYRELFNTFIDVTFPISVLASVTNQELVSYAWIFPNVIYHGHWWYSNTPSFISRDLSARVEAVPRNKIIGYYSDMYKLEFALPKFAMFKRCLSQVLADQFVIQRGWSEQRAVALGIQILRGNVESTFQLKS